MLACPVAGTCKIGLFQSLICLEVLNSNCESSKHFLATERRQQTKPITLPLAHVHGVITVVSQVTACRCSSLTPEIYSPGRLPGEYWVITMCKRRGQCCSTVSGVNSVHARSASA